jgi:hypothetical protein
MELLDIPGTSLRASRIALGTWAIGGWMWGGTDEAEAIATIRAAVERGITLIDTAPVYGFGRSEEIVGKALAEDGLRKRVLIATKVGLDWKDGQPFRNASKTRIQKEIEDSLRRLRTDVIDIYQVHWPDPNVPKETTAALAAAARRQDSGDRRQQFQSAQIEARCAGAYGAATCNLFDRAIGAASCLIAGTAASSRWPMALCAGVCFLAAWRRRRNLAGTTCEGTTPSSKLRGLRSTCGRWKGSTVSRN